MGAMETRTFTLTREQAAFIDEKVATGEYGSASDVVQDGLRALQGLEVNEAPVVEDWMLEEARKTLEQLEAGTMKTIPADEVFASLRERYQARKAQLT